MSDDFDAIRQSGDWSVNPWWLKDNWLEVIPRTPEQVQAAFQYLRQVFDADWLRAYSGEPVENLLLRSVLYGGDAFRRAHLILLAERLQRLQEAPGIHVLVSALKGRGESDAADMELELADIFFQKGFQVEFPIPKPSKGKTPDIRISKGNERLAIECKLLKIGELPAWLNAAFSAATSEVFGLAKVHGFAGQFQFEPETATYLLGLRSNGVEANTAGEMLTRQIAYQIKLASDRERKQVWIEIQNIGSGFFYKAESTAGSIVHNPDTPDEFLFRRLFKNALIPAVEQLQREDIPGIVAIHARDVPSEELLAKEVDRFLEQNRNNYTNIHAVLIFPWQSWFQRNRPRLIVNPLSREAWNSCEASRVLLKLDPIIL